MTMGRIKTIITGLITLIVLVAGFWEAFKWTVMRVYVGPTEALIVTNKFGKPLPADRIVVPVDDNSFKGVQEEVRGPGRYFIDPVRFEWETKPLVEISAGDPDKWQWNDDGTLKNPQSA